MPDEVERKGIEEVSTSIVQVLQAIFTATKTVLIYPPENPSVIRMVEVAHEAVTVLIPLGGALDLSFIEDKMVVNGQVLDDALQKRGVIRSFHELLKTRRVSSITFWDGLTKDELRKFLIILAVKAPTLGSEETVEVDQLLQDEEIKHVEVDEQIYVAISKREKVVDARAALSHEEDSAVRALKDEVFARFLAGEVSPGELDKGTMQNMLADPEKMVEMVQGVVSAQGWDTEVRSMPFRVDETRAILERVSGLVSEVDDPLVRSKLNKEIDKVTTQIDAPQLTEMLLSSTGKTGTEISGLSSVVLPLLDDHKLMSVVESVVEEYSGLAGRVGRDDWPTPRMVALRSIMDEAASSAGEELAGSLGRMIDDAGLKQGKPEETATVTGESLARLLTGGGGMEQCEMAPGPTLVGAARHLFKNGEDELGAGVMSALAVKYRKQSEESRSVAAQQIWGLFQELRELGKEVYTADLIDEVSGELDKGRSAVEAFGQVAQGLEEMGAAATGESAGPYQALGAVDGMPVSAKAIEKIMSADTGKVVQAVFRSGDPAAREAMIQALAGMEDRALPALVSSAMEATDMERLESVADSIKQLGIDPMPQVTSRLSGELQPNETINLIRLVSIVGNESSVSVFNPLLVSEDLDMQKEVIRALGRLGGKQSLQMLLTESANYDVQLRAAAVRELDKFKDYLAVRRLMEVIAPKKKGELPEDEAVLSAACRSLGELAVRQAVPSLIEIAKGGRRQELSEELRSAATVALGMIGDEPASKELRHLLKDRSMLVRSTARRALGGA